MEGRERPMRDHDRGAGLWGMADLTVPMAIRVAATLRIADHIARGVRTAPELAKEVDADPDALERVLRHLAAAGVLAHARPDGYTLAAPGEALRADHPDGMRARLDMEGAVGRAELSFVQLLHTVRTGERAYPLQFGRTFWEDLSADPALAESFDSIMAYNLGTVASAVVSAVDWSTLAHVVDVGGGNGSLLITLLRRNPALKGTLVELPGPADAAREALEAAGLSERADVVEGDFFAPLPSGADGYLLSDVLHNWNDEAAAAILRRCAEAAGASGSVFVIGAVGPDGESPSTDMDLRMLAYFGGRERDLGELTRLAEKAGLVVRDVHGVDDVAIVEFTAS
jgi:O-methyltransferase domain